MNYDVVHVTIHHHSHLANIATSLQAKTLALACPTKTRVGALNSSSPPKKKLSFNWDHHPIFKHNILEATRHNGWLYLVLYHVIPPFLKVLSLYPSFAGFYRLKPPTNLLRPAFVVATVSQLAYAKWRSQRRGRGRPRGRSSPGRI